jgi:hypothetical protein
MAHRKDRQTTNCLGEIHKPGAFLALLRDSEERGETIMVPAIQQPTTFLGEPIELGVLLTLLRDPKEKAEKPSRSVSIR